MAFEYLVYTFQNFNCYCSYVYGATIPLLCPIDSVRLLTQYDALVLLFTVHLLLLLLLLYYLKYYASLYHNQISEAQLP